MSHSTDPLSRPQEAGSRFRRSLNDLESFAKDMLDEASEDDEMGRLNALLAVQAKLTSAVCERLEAILQALQTRTREEG